MFNKLIENRKPCPFCGGNRIEHSSESNYYFVMRKCEGHSCVTVACRDCYGEISYHTFKDKKKDEQYATALIAAYEKWNMRA